MLTARSGFVVSQGKLKRKAMVSDLSVYGFEGLGCGVFHRTEDVRQTCC